MGRLFVWITPALVLAALLACKKESSPSSEPAPTPATDPAVAATGKDFAGTWDSAWGRLTLTQTGSAVTGDYSGQFTGRLAGRAEGNVATLTWTQTNGETGQAKFTLSDDGDSFAGTWGSGQSATSGGSWNGTRRH